MGEMYKKFTNQYSLSKVLRFSLIPQGKTRENMEKDNLLGEDEVRAENYKTVKKLIDRYHKEFIEKVMGKFALSNLDEYYAYYQDSARDEKKEKAFEDLKASMRKEISKAFKQDSEYKGLFGKEIIRQYLPNYLKEASEIDIVKEFDNFTTYFTGFYQNRENMYTEEDQTTAIAHRLITQNLPKFLDNMKVYQEIKKHEELLNEIQKIEKELGEFACDSLEEVFTPEYYNNVLTNKGIQNYNVLLGGYVDEKQKKIQGINEYINLYNQQISSKERKIPKLKPLYKQILADREEISFIPESFSDDREVIAAVRQIYQNVEEELFEPKNGLPIKEIFSSWDDYQLDKIYLKNDLSLTQISQQMYGTWSVIQEGLNQIYDDSYKGKKKSQEAYEEERKKHFKKYKGYSIRELNEAVSKVDSEKLPVEEYFSRMGYKENILEKIELSYEAVKELLEEEYPENRKLKKDGDSTERIKNLLDALLELQHLLKMFYVTEMDKDERFYYELDRMQTILDTVIPVYNQVRNYITGKPYSTEKIKLNFGNAQLLGGWDKNKERDYTSVILRKDGKYYLGIMNKKHNDIFLDKIVPEENDGVCYEKMEYKLLPGPNKMFPKVFFSNSRIDEFAPTKEILNIREKESFKKGSKFNLSDCHKFIDFFKSSIQKHEEWNKFNFQFSDTSTYSDISGFYREVEQQNYKLSFVNLPKFYVDRMVEEGKLYLFQIYNKDFSQYSHGKKNLHTIYWEMLFSPVNLEDVVYKLNGEAEVFYRKASLPGTVTHPANVPIKKKVPNEAGKYEESVFEYDLIKDKRFTMDKFQFHVSISLNYKAQGNDNINEYTKQVLHNQKETYAIGIDRGERNLLYLCVVDPNGKIVHQESMNTIQSSKGNKQNYHRLLSEREQERDKARKNWQSIEGIKDLKEGYLSLVIHRITELMVKYDAVVVLEDLNFGFMRGRQKVEKQVYQKFEKMLIDKLNYLVLKDVEASEYGGSLKAYQLTSKFTSFKRLGNQSGVLFYIPAWNTSKMDPTTGFVNLLYPKYSSVDEAKKYISKFDRIFYDKENGYFVWQFDYDNFTEKAAGTRTKWEICTYGERIENFRNPERNSEWDYHVVKLTEEMKMLFDKYGVSYEKERNLVETISGLESGGKEFYSELIHLLKLTLQIRNSIPNAEEDYLISPVKNKKGEFFCTKNSPDYLPDDADGNGAYNIARKGLWAMEQIRNTGVDELRKVKLAMTNKEWLKYAQDNTVV